MSELSPEEQAIADEALAEADQGPIHGDLTSGPVLKTLVAFSIPMLIGNVVQTLNGSINAIWIGRLLGENALAATTNANGVMFLVFAMVFGFGTATTVRVGQHFGARNVNEARRTFGSGLGFCVALSIILAVIGWFGSPTLLKVMSTPAGSVDLANTYLRVIFLSIPFGTANMMLGMSLRGAGDSKSPLYAMVLTVALDIVLNPLLIRGLGPIPGLGIAGSAIASFCAGLGGVSLLIFNLYRKDLALRLRGAEFGYLVPRSEELRYILVKGVPMGGQMLLVSTAQLAVMNLVNLEGVDSTAAYGASMQLWNYLQMPAMAISTGVSAMVAQNIGAGHHERVSQVAKAGMISNVLMTGVLGTLILSFSQPLLALFLGSGSPALPIAQHIQYIVTWSFLVMGVSMVVGGTMRAYGVVVWPLIFQLVCFYPIRLGFYYLAYPRLGADALWWAFPVASTTSVVLSTLLYTRGSWRQKRHLVYRKI